MTSSDKVSSPSYFSTFVLVYISYQIIIIVFLFTIFIVIDINVVNTSVILISLFVRSLDPTIYNNVIVDWRQTKTKTSLQSPVNVSKGDIHYTEKREPTKFRDNKQRPKVDNLRLNRSISRNTKIRRNETSFTRS